MRFLHGLIMAGLALAGPVAAETWAGPDPARQPAGSRDLDYAMAEVCYPFLLQNASITQVSENRGYRLIPSGNPANRGLVLTLQIGGKDMNVLLDTRTADRDCDISIQGGDTAQLHEVAMNRLAQWPVPLLPGRYSSVHGAVRDDDMCSARNDPPGGPNDRVKIYSDDSPGRTPSFSLTLSRSDIRWPMC